MLKKGVFAGTFGPLHNGHMFIIDAAMEMISFLVIGLTTESIANKKIEGTEQIMPSYRERAKMIDIFMVSKGFVNRYAIVPVSDGVAEGVDFNGDVMFISDEDSVLGRAQHINTLRRIKKLQELAIVIFPRIRFQDGTVVSSTGIREANVL